MLSLASSRSVLSSAVPLDLPGLLDDDPVARGRAAVPSVRVREGRMKKRRALSRLDARGRTGHLSSNATCGAASTARRLP
jgi:hypothetical protein